MIQSRRDRFAFRPSLAESGLEERLVLSAAGPRIAIETPPTRLASTGTTPAPAARPAQLPRAGAAVGPLTVAKLRGDYDEQVHAATRALRSVVEADAATLFARGSTPTAPRRANLDAGVTGALDATTLRLATEASLLPNSSRLVSAIEDRFLGSGADSIVNRLTSAAGSGQLVRANGTLTRAFAMLADQGVSLFDGYFDRTAVNRLSVDSSGRHILLARYIGTRLLNQVGDTLGSLAASVPTAADSILFPDGVTGTPTRAALDAFDTAYDEALNTAAFELGSGLALFRGDSDAVTHLERTLLGGLSSDLGGLFGSSASSSDPSGVVDGTAAFDTAITDAFDTAYQDLAAPLSRCFGMSTPSTPSLPTAGLTSVFGTSSMSPTFSGGLSEGLGTSKTPGLIGFGAAPTGISTNFGLGFNHYVNNFDTSLGFNPTGLGAGIDGVGGKPGAERDQEPNRQLS